MSLGTDRGAWHADPDFGSDLWLLKQGGKVDGQTAAAVERAVAEALQWLIAGGIARSVECRAERNGKSRIDFLATITRPDGSQAKIKEAWSVV